MNHIDTNDDSNIIFNRVLLGLRPEALAFVVRKMVTKPLVAGMVLYEEGEPFTHAIFPQTGIISLLGEMEDGRTSEKTSIGNEGFLDFTYLMGCSAAASKMIVQVPGYASWLSLQDLEEAMHRFECVHRVMLHYAKALIVQILETVACNQLHSAEQRVSRWLLHADDRMLGEQFELTHQALSTALVLRRATVSNVCAELKKAGAISYTRGVVTVTDSGKLRAHSCKCYDHVVTASLPKKEQVNTQVQALIEF